MKSLNQITVNIPTLNEENNILNCINSIKKSGIKKIIVIDGGSTDKTLKIVKKKNIKYYIAKKKGLAFQRALGVKKSKTKYIALIDADHRPIRSSFLKMLTDLDTSDYVAVQPIIVSKKKNMNYFEKSYQKLCDINVNIKGTKKMIGLQRGKTNSQEVNGFGKFVLLFMKVIGILRLITLFCQLKTFGIFRKRSSL